MIKGTLFNIQRFSVHDGPGIRTTVFFKGCPLRCLWCHNPEGLSSRLDIEFNTLKCIGCGRCCICPNGCHKMENGSHIFDRTSCKQCGKCTEVCVSGSLSMSGMICTIDEVMKTVEKDIPFYKESGGGMTLSGGEPFLQIDFAVELLRSAHERGIHTAVETCGYYSDDVLARALPYVDLFLFDYKVTGSDAHRNATGVGNESILANLKTIDEFGAEIVLRCPIIPTVNDNPEHYDAIAAIAESHHSITRVDLEPYHNLGSSKYINIGRRPVEFTPPEKEKMEKIREYIGGRTGKKVVIS